MSCPSLLKKNPSLSSRKVNFFSQQNLCWSLETFHLFLKVPDDCLDKEMVVLAEDLVKHMSRRIPSPVSSHLSVREIEASFIHSCPTNNAPLNKFQLSSENSARSFLEQKLGQILLISADWAYDSVSNMDKHLCEGIFLLSFHFCIPPLLVGYGYVQCLLCQCWVARARPLFFFLLLHKVQRTMAKKVHLSILLPSSPQQSNVTKLIWLSCYACMLFWMVLKLCTPL